MKKTLGLNFELVIALICLLALVAVLWRSNPVPSPEHIVGPDLEILLYRRPAELPGEVVGFPSLDKPDDLVEPLRLTWNDLAGYDPTRAAIILAPDAARRLEQDSQWVAHGEFRETYLQTSRSWIWFELTLNGRLCVAGDTGNWNPNDFRAGYPRRLTVWVARTNRSHLALFIMPDPAYWFFSGWGKHASPFGAGLHLSPWQAGRYVKGPRCPEALSSAMPGLVMIDYPGLERLFHWYGKLVISEE